MNNNNNNSFDVSRISKNRWEQGSCLLLAKKYKNINRGLYIVISQDCDIVNPDLRKEPYIELIYATEIEQRKGLLEIGKNPRQLHLSVEKNGEKAWLEFFPYNRCFLPRGHLQYVLPDKKFVINKRSLKILIKWLVNRYSRAAFPYEFNLRVQKVLRDQIEGIMGEDCRKTLGLFIRLNTDQDLPKQEKYYIEIVMLIDPEEREDYEKASNGFGQIISVLSKVDGIEITDPIIDGVQIKAKVLLTNEISEYEVRRFDKWDFDYLSFVDGSDGETMDVVA